MNHLSLTENAVCKVKYIKDSGEESVRYIIPYRVPSHLVNAFDVTELTEDGRVLVADLRRQYSEYIDQLLRTAFTFEQWAEHQNLFTPPLKHRSFKTTGLSCVE